MNKLMLIACSLLLFANLVLCQSDRPYLKNTEGTVQLIVDEKPFLILGGELGNSTATTVESMEWVWPKLKNLNLNTVLIPVFWELVEPQEGAFDFSLYEKFIEEARQNELRIVFLWFGSWKNSMSSHVPAWVKLNQDRFPKSKDKNGKTQDILSVFSPAVLDADRRAFVQLMKFIKDVDHEQHTVIMVQVENEIGMLPSARDHHHLAEVSFQKEVPSALLKYIQNNQPQLVPFLKDRLENYGYKKEGTWEEVFGRGIETEEIFMAWHYSVFANALAEAGKKAYDLPMFVNAALIRPGRLPGQYPSAGPLPHLMDIWKAGGTAIDFMAPDFYNPDFKKWCDLYTQQGDVLFVPEHSFDYTVGPKAIYTFGHYKGLGFAPFSIESRGELIEKPLSSAYQLLENMSPLIADAMISDKIEAVLLSGSHQDTIVRMGKYMFECKHHNTLPWAGGTPKEDWPHTSILIIQSGEDEFYMAGSGVVVKFINTEAPNKTVGLLKVEEGLWEDDKWKITRHLNGDQIHQGRHVSIPTSAYTIQRVELYSYE